MLTAQKFFEFPSETSAKAACRAVRVELKNTYEKRSRTQIDTNKNVVFLKIVASDEMALNASLHAYTRSLGLCRNILLLEV